MVFFYHAYKVQQPGTVTRIVSGCINDKEEQEQMQFFEKYIRPMNPQWFRIHFTPSYSSIHKTSYGPYKYMNKRTFVVDFVC